MSNESCNVDTELSEAVYKLNVAEMKSEILIAKLEANRKEYSKASSELSANVYPLLMLKQEVDRLMSLKFTKTVNKPPTELS